MVATERLQTPVDSKHSEPYLMAPEEAAKIQQ